MLNVIFSIINNSQQAHFRFRGLVKYFYVSDFVWSLSNDVILSVSLDGTARLWDVAAGTCMRVIEDGSGAELLTCLFQPLNNNMFVVSFQNRVSPDVTPSG